MCECFFTVIMRVIVLRIRNNSQIPECETVRQGFPNIDKYLPISKMLDRILLNFNTYVHNVYKLTTNLNNHLFGSYHT